MFPYCRASGYRYWTCLQPRLRNDRSYNTPAYATVILTANCYHFGGNDNNYKFTFIIDVLLVPLSFNVQTCFDLYLEPFNPGSRTWFMGTRRLRDNIILLRRFAVQGDYMACAAEQCDIPEHIRNRADHRLVVTCPVFHYASECTERGLYFQLEMEFTPDESGPSTGCGCECGCGYRCRC